MKVKNMPRRLSALFFDLGDTIMLEETEVKDEFETTLTADLIPGMSEALHLFSSQGHRLALVADARPDGPVNVLRQHKLIDLFSYLAISESLGMSKPDPRIFRAALDALNIPPSDFSRVAMVGNNLERDVVGANRLGLISIFYHGNERRRTTPQSQEEEPRHIVTSAAELVALIERLDREPVHD